MDVGHQSVGELAEQQLRGLILDRALALFPGIDDTQEGYVAALDRFHGPLCSRYAEDPAALERHHLARSPHTLSVTFGVVNWARRQHQYRLARAESLLQDTAERLAALRRNPDAHRLMTRRVTQPTLDSPEAADVITLIRTTIPADLVRLGLADSLQRFLNVSHGAWRTLLESWRRELSD